MIPASVCCIKVSLTDFGVSRHMPAQLLLPVVLWIGVCCQTWLWVCLCFSPCGSNCPPLTPCCSHPQKIFSSFWSRETDQVETEFYKKSCSALLSPRLGCHVKRTMQLHIVRSEDCVGVKPLAHIFCTSVPAQDAGLATVCYF